MNHDIGDLILHNQHGLGQIVTISNNHRFHRMLYSVRFFKEGERIRSYWEDGIEMHKNNLRTYLEVRDETRNR